MDIYKDRIKPLFEKSGKTNADLEREIGIPAKKIYQWNKGHLSSYQKYIPKIASYFHVSTDYLLGNTDALSHTSQKEKPIPKDEDGLTPAQKEAWAMLQRMDDDTLVKFIKIAKAMLGE